MWKKENKDAGRSRWYPFASMEEWELAAWLLQNVGHNKIDQFLKLEMVRSQSLTITSKYTFFQKIDRLPQRHGTEWRCDEISITGNIANDSGEPASEKVELWRRDPVECVRELIGNPAFRDAIAYAPEQVYLDNERKSRIVDEMWTADWWWKTQEKLPRGATIAPVILASDKTKLSSFRGDQTAWPVYLSIGNIAKATHRHVSARATVLLGYIPVSKLECFSTVNDARRLASYRLYHHCMRTILEPLIEAGKQGVSMVCADGCVRRVHPIVAAYVADHPEQCLIVNVQENHCPRGTVHPDDRGEHVSCPPRNTQNTLDLLSSHARGDTIDTLPHGLRTVYEPFWDNLPFCDIFSSITPDILHQLHKGVFKDHLVSWITAIVSEEELDRRFKAMADVPGLRHFKKGISHVQQWTGAEHKEMQKVFVVLVAGAVDEKVLRMVQSLIDFIYYSQLQLHTTETINALKHSLDVFHRNKSVFQDLEIREHFNIAKIHAMMHYVEAIWEKGALDGYNTELSERLHIDFAKAGYRAGNRHDYIAHMTTWLRRQEAVKDRLEFYQWLSEGSVKATSESVSEDNDNDDGDNNDIRFTPSVTPRAYRIAKKCSYRHVPLQRLQHDHNATEFLPALHAFIHIHYPNTPFLPQPTYVYNVYKQLKIEQPWNQFISSELWLDRVRAIAPIEPRGRLPALPGVFDLVLVIEDLAKFRQQKLAGSSPVDGLRIARLRVIFELPPELGRMAHPLAYIEWYTPFQRFDPVTNLYQVSRSSHNRRPNAAIVSVDHILGTCHLAAKCGAEIDRDLTSENVLDRASVFTVNPYLNFHTFTSSGLYCLSACI
ncbi:hypothetical protein BDY19DRAFT_899724 [Irpex rosettiformis]|uniref:Uncharacterized protein n=1 Tax=Irpex rosettiformis TaxID=378272 RepID=A0ACB8TP22_9APHY|nr:hypothetical protein BDY19DRAFT_899724 [Irpex rosettiformis]